MPSFSAPSLLKRARILSAAEADLTNFLLQGLGLYLDPQVSSQDLPPPFRVPNNVCQTCVKIAGGWW